MLKRNYYLTVNYGSSHHITSWVASIKLIDKNAVFYLVDNFHSDKELYTVRDICIDNDINLIESSNVGYGRGLNIGLSNLLNNNDCNYIFFGNLDIEFVSLPKLELMDDGVIVPTVLENGLNRNPFLTVLQKKFLFLHKISIYSNSLIVFRFVILIQKFLSFFPSDIWAVHGSQFAISFNLLKNKGSNIFNPNSFLYAEELEFASYFQDEKFIQNVGFVVKHTGGISTNEFFSSRREFYDNWKISMRAWFKRWY